MDEFDLDDYFCNLPPVKQPRYRIYYDEFGYPTSYSVDDLPGNYIDVDAAVYMSGETNIRIIDGKIVKIKMAASFIFKLVPSEEGICCEPNNVCIIVNDTEPHTKWNLKTYEKN